MERIESVSIMFDCLFVVIMLSMVIVFSNRMKVLVMMFCISFCDPKPMVRLMILVSVNNGAMLMLSLESTIRVTIMERKIIITLRSSGSKVCVRVLCSIILLRLSTL